MVELPLSVLYRIKLWPLKFNLSSCKSSFTALYVVWKNTNIILVFTLPPNENQSGMDGSEEEAEERGKQVQQSYIAKELPTVR